jgi:DNA-binding transcriptional LysR family regulator
MRVLPLTTRDPRQLLDEGQMDLAVGFFPAVLADLTAQAQAGGVAPFDHQRLFAGEYVCVMRKGHPLAKGALTLARYASARHLLVSFSGRPFGFVDEALASLGRTRRIVLTVNQFFTAGRVVAGSDLVTVLPRHFVKLTGLSEQFVLRELPFDVAPVLVDSLWHRRQGQRSDHAWLRLAMAAAAQKAFGGAV